jgi:hypothetical protein
MHLALGMTGIVIWMILVVTLLIAGIAWIGVGRLPWTSVRSRPRNGRHAARPNRNRTRT